MTPEITPRQWSDKSLIVSSWSYLSVCLLTKKTLVTSLPTEMAITAITTKISIWKQWINSRNISWSIQKFDMIVYHPICLLKILVLWDKNYLTNRSQIVNYNNRFSSKQKTLCGVPPASVLGSLLFLLYIEDMSSKILSYIFFLLMTLIEIFRF